MAFFILPMDGAPSNVCKCSHHKFIPGLMVLFGLLFLGRAMGWVSMELVDWGWPIIVMVGGILKMMEGKCKCC